VYGVEAQSGGLGGLAAQAPPDVYFPQAVGIHNVAPIIGSPEYEGGTTAPTFGPTINTQLATGLMQPGVVSGSGNAVRAPVVQMQHTFSSIFDFHNSPAPWILLALLFLYGWLHASVRFRAGRASAAAVL
jgi:hypothetical protein